MIYSNLKEILEKNSITPAELSEKTNLSMGTIYNLINGKTTGIDFGTLEVLCNTLKTSPSEIISYYPGCIDIDIKLSPQKQWVGSFDIEATLRIIHNNSITFEMLLYGSSSIDCYDSDKPEEEFADYTLYVRKEDDYNKFKNLPLAIQREFERKILSILIPQVEKDTPLIKKRYFLILCDEVVEREFEEYSERQYQERLKERKEAEKLTGAEKLKKLRIELNLTMTELSDLTNISRTTLSLIENHNRRITYINAEKLGKFQKNFIYWYYNRKET